MRDGPKFPTCLSQLVVQQSEDTQRTTDEVHCSDDNRTIHQVGGAEGSYSEVIFDFETTFPREFPLHPSAGYVETFNAGVVGAQGRVVVTDESIYFSSTMLILTCL